MSTQLSGPPREQKEKRAGPKESDPVVPKPTQAVFSSFRHEIGHSLIPVGEEYEGGYAYFGGEWCTDLTPLEYLC